MIINEDTRRALNEMLVGRVASHLVRQFQCGHNTVSTWIKNDALGAVQISGCPCNVDGERAQVVQENVWERYP